MGFGPLGPTSPPGSVEPDRLRSGSVNRPSPAPSLFPLSSSSFLANPRSLPLSPAHSGQPRWPLSPMLGTKPSPQLPLPPTPVGIDGSFPSEEIWGGFPPRFLPSPVASDLMPRQALSCLLCNLWWLWCVSVVVVLQCSWCAVVKTTLGSLWSTAQALPCHAVQTSTWASMSVISPPL
jgi:hypothetical protein